MSGNPPALTTLALVYWWGAASSCALCLDLRTEVQSQRPEVPNPVERDQVSVVLILSVFRRARNEHEVVAIQPLRTDT